MRIGSLFSGAGGLDMAVEQVFGGTTVWHVENDPAASKVLAHRWPGVPNHHDITQVDWDTVEPVDILCGGWPCQPFSHAGKRLGAADDRALWPYVAGAIRMVRPRIVVLENVSAVLTAGEFQRVADDLAEAGYEFAWVCVRASDAGAPHRRERVFVCASLADSSSDGWHQRRPEPARQLGGSDAAVSGDRPVNLLPTPNAQDGNGGGRYNAEGHQSTLPGEVRLLPTPRTSDSFGPGLHGDGGMDLRTTISLLPTPTQGDGTGGGIRNNLTWDGTTQSTGEGGNSRLRDVVGLLNPDVQWGRYTPAIRRWENLTRPAPAPTEPNRNGNPRLNPAFSEWLMGWPNGWVTDPDIGISRNDALRIIGNGVVPQQAHTALTHLLNLTPAPNPESLQLLPTPTTMHRASRRALIGITDPTGNRRHWTQPGLEQAIEISRGILPHELNDWDELNGRHRRDMPTLFDTDERTGCPPPPTASPAPSATAPSGKHQTGQ